MTQPERRRKTTPGTAPGGLACSFCGRRFSRPSHYDRHCRTHLPPEGRLALPCAKCGKTFARNDVLLRHLRAAHGVHLGPQPKTTQRSCYRCVRLRRRCDRGQPCRLCAAAGHGASCAYAPETAAAAAAAEAYTMPEPASQSHVPLVLSDGRACQQQDPFFHGGGNGGTDGCQAPPEHAFAGSLASSSDDAGHAPFLSGQDPAAAASAASAAATAATAGCSPSFSDELYLAADAAPFVASLSAAGQLDFRTAGAGLDWLDFDVPDFFATSSPGILPQMDPSLPSPLSPPLPLTPAVGPAASGLGPAGPVTSSSSPVLPWPFDYAAAQDTSPQRCSLPPLREVLQTTLLRSTNPTPPNQSVLANLVALMSDARMPPLDEEATDPGMAHAASLLKRLVDTYVTRFQPILPLLHVPTWDLADSPPVLVSAMTCVGSLLSDDARVAGLSWSISDICMPMIAWLGSTDSENYRDIAYLSALCIHQIYSLGSGNRQLYQNADRSRGILVGGLRGMGCLTTRLQLDDDAAAEAVDARTDADGAATAQHLREQWLAWVSREREKRTAWSSFEYDCSLSTLTGRRGAVDLSELPSRLPCTETLWDAPSAHAWAALRTRLHPDALGAPLSRLLKTVLAGEGEERARARDKGILAQVSFWGRRLCAQVIGRLLWDLKQLDTLSTSEYFGMPSLSAAQAANKARLLRALDNLMASMDQPTTVADLISYNIANLIGHCSHLYTAHDVLDTMLYIVRSTVTHGAKLNTGIQMARRRLVATLARDPPAARRLVYHAAQIVAVADDYLVSAPCEILRLFLGCTFLILYAAYCPPGSGHHAHAHPDAGSTAPPALQLDVPAHRASARAVDGWIAHGGPAAIGTARNIYADGAALTLSREAQSRLQRLTCWGLADKFTKILQSFESTALEGGAHK